MHTFPQSHGGGVDPEEIKTSSKTKTKKGQNQRMKNVTLEYDVAGHIRLVQ